MKLVYIRFRSFEESEVELVYDRWRWVCGQFDWGASCEEQNSTQVIDRVREISGNRYRYRACTRLKISV